jgi:hypothetical protein
LPLAPPGSSVDSPLVGLDAPQDASSSGRDHRASRAAVSRLAARRASLHPYGHPSRLDELGPRRWRPS